MGMIITYLAVASWCALAYMVPVVWAIVWYRRHRDRTEVIQDGDVVVTDDWLRVDDDE